MFSNPLGWQPDIDEFAAPLRQSTPFLCLLDRFSKGIDNTHHDVTLSPAFTAKTQQFVRRTLAHETMLNDWGEAPPVPDSKDAQLIVEDYIGMMEVAVDHARKNTRLELIQCLQFAVMKFYLQVVDSEFERLRGQMQRVRDVDQQSSSGRSVQVHERLVDLAKSGPDIKYRLVRQLFRELLKAENMRLSKLRKSVLGRSWVLPKQLMFNPILQLPSLWADEQMMEHYPLVCTDRDDEDGFDRVNRVVVELFAQFLPSWALAADKQPDGETSISDLPSLALRCQHGANSLKGFGEVELVLARSLQTDEIKQGLRSWLDMPENIDRFIYSVSPSAALRTEHDTRFVECSWSHPSWPKFQQRLLKKMLRSIANSGIEKDILACHAAPGVYQELSGTVPVRLICQYLAVRINRKDLQRKLLNIPTVADPDAVIVVLDRTYASIKAMPKPRCRRRVYSFMRHFLLLRRDLKLAYQAYASMDKIRLLERPEDLALSRNNGTLVEFMLRGELRPETNRIRNHVIIKADMRGSTSITSELRRKNLNPASHFSINFFEPINKLLERYGAKKVFVEGDAVILSIFEYEDTPYQWLCVSHACGLARKILQVVDAQNALNRKNGLPELEIGLGIAFSDESPAFLYDEDREIMISAAINRADQLSSCSAAVRKTEYGKGLGRGIAVFTPSNENIVDKVCSDRLIRYNVNGIELDIPAFYKLKSEVALKMISLTTGRGGGRTLVGQFPDIAGSMHWLVVAETPVLEWDGVRAVAAEKQGRRCYQVVTDQKLIDQAVEVVVRSQRSKPARLDETQIITPRHLH